MQDAMEFLVALSQGKALRPALKPKRSRGIFEVPWVAGLHRKRRMSAKERRTGLNVYPIDHNVIRMHALFL